MGEATTTFPANHLKAKLGRGEVVSSMIVRLVTSPEIALIAQATGFDALYVDLEHNSFSLGEACHICQVAQGAGVTPLVRVPGISHDMIGRLLDGGAMGVIVPGVETAADAATLVGLTKYPPEGTRSAGGPLAQNRFVSPSSPADLAALNEAVLVAVMVESKTALGNVEAIAATRGIDLLLVGASDLTADLGIAGDFDHPMVKDAVLRVIEAAKRHGKHVGLGGLTSRPKLIAELVAAGARYISTGTDISFLMGGAARQVAFVEGLKAPVKGGATS